MHRLSKYRPTPSMIVATVALIVAMGGVGVAAVTLANNSVLSKHIKNGQVKTADLAKNAVTSTKIKDSAVGSAKIQDGTVGIADLSAAASADLNDASTVGGLTPVQIIAATGGKYFEARQAAGTVDVNTLTDKTLATLNLPEAGKYLISARMPVNCTYDGTGAVSGLPPNTDQVAPYFVAKAKLFVGGTLTDTVVDSCQAEASNFALVAPVLFGTKTVEITRQIDVTGPTTVQLKGLAETSLIFVVITIIEQPSAARVTATASGSILQAITVRT